MAANVAESEEKAKTRRQQHGENGGGCSQKMPLRLPRAGKSAQRKSSSVAKKYAQKRVGGGYTSDSILTYGKRRSAWLPAMHSRMRRSVR